MKLFEILPNVFAENKRRYRKHRARKFTYMSVGRGVGYGGAEPSGNGGMINGGAGGAGGGGGE